MSTSSSATTGSASGPPRSRRRFRLRNRSRLRRRPEPSSSSSPPRSIAWPPRWPPRPLSRWLSRPPSRWLLSRGPPSRWLPSRWLSRCSPPSRAEPSREESSRRPRWRRSPRRCPSCWPSARPALSAAPLTAWPASAPVGEKASWPSAPLAPCPAGPGPAELACAASRDPPRRASRVVVAASCAGLDARAASPRAGCVVVSDSMASCSRWRGAPAPADAPRWTELSSAPLPLPAGGPAERPLSWAGAPPCWLWVAPPPCWAPPPPPLLWMASMSWLLRSRPVPVMPIDWASR